MNTTTPSEEDFPQFARFPAEIRIMVWEYCVSRTVLATNREVCSNLLPEKGQNEVWSPGHPGTTKPALLSINTEARDVALRYGRKVRLVGAGTAWEEWIQPNLDTVHLAWRKPCITRGLHWSDTMCPELHSLLAEAVVKRMRISVPAERLCQFPARYDTTMELSPRMVTDVGVFLDRGEDHTYDLSRWIPDNQVIVAVFKVVHIHAHRPEILQSGLFGFLGDAPVQLVPYDDREALLKYQSLLDACGLRRRDYRAEYEFEYILSTQFQNDVKYWESCAKWLLFAQRWRHERRVAESSEALDAVWLPRTAEIPNDDLKRMQHDRFDEDHPWVMDTRQKLPKLELNIMFKWCESDCISLGPRVRGVFNYFVHRGHRAYSV